jgi:hypothetical protein
MEVQAKWDSDPELKGNYRFILKETLGSFCFPTFSFPFFFFALKEPFLLSSLFFFWREQWTNAAEEDP